MVLFNVRTPLLILQRNITKRPYKWYDEGIQYVGFKYYPKDPENFQDPPCEPTKLFRIQRIKPVKGTPYWERDLLRNFKLLGKQNECVIVKNIPEVNSLLWRIKHLIKIEPITFPNGFPEDANGAYLKENGELIVSKKLKPVETRLEATENFIKKETRMDGDTLRRESRKRWLTGLQPM